MDPGRRIPLADDLRSPTGQALDRSSRTIRRRVGVRRSVPLCMPSERTCPGTVARRGRGDSTSELNRWCVAGTPRGAVGRPFNGRTARCRLRSAQGWRPRPSPRLAVRPRDPPPVDGREPDTFVCVPTGYVERWGTRTGEGRRGLGAALAPDPVGAAPAPRRGARRTHGRRRACPGRDIHRWAVTGARSRWRRRRFLSSRSSPRRRSIETVPSHVNELERVDRFVTLSDYG